MEEERIDIDKMERSRFAEGKNRLYFLNGLDKDQELFGETDLYADAEEEKTRDAIKNSNDGNHLAALLGLILRKRINYKYEEEIRLMCLRKPALAKDGSYKSGITVKIPNIKKCITTIRIDPRLGPRTTKAIKEILGKHLPSKVSKSAMNNNASFKKPIQL